MNEILKLILTFISGALVGRYFVQIIRFLNFMRKDIENIREEANK
jgi:hypothetical protein